MRCGAERRGRKAFVSGADISKFENERSNEKAIAHYNEVVDQASKAIENSPKPAIAMIRGYCVGGGLGIALGCDLRICADDARFALPAAKLGVSFGFSGIKRFVDTVGPSFTKEFFHRAAVRHRRSARHGSCEPRRAGRRT